MTSSAGRIGLVMASPLSRPHFWIQVQRQTPGIYTANRWLWSSPTVLHCRQHGSGKEMLTTTGAGFSPTLEPMSSFSVTKRQYFSTTPRQHPPPPNNLDENATSQQQPVNSQEESEHEKEEATKRIEEDFEQESESSSDVAPSLMLKDQRLPCAQHLDPDGTMLPTSDWIHINGTLPIGSLDQIIQSTEQWLRLEEEKGIIDLDAEWNPVNDAQVPLISLEDLAENQTPMIEAAHVVLSPFGRPNGWHIKLANRSLVYSILARGQQGHLRVGWKVVQVGEYHFSKERHEREDPAFAENDGLLVDNSMVRIENCPPDMESEYVRYILSRYDLAYQGNTVLRWKGKTNDGKVAPLMYIVRFASASWARAAVRELQSTVFNGGKKVKLIQYPKQIRYQDTDSATD
jgi:hypothetical protein